MLEVVITLLQDCNDLALFQHSGKPSQWVSGLPRSVFIGGF